MDFEWLETERIHHGRAFDVERVQVRTPDGKQRKYDLVRHPGAVTILPIDDEGNVLFVTQYRMGSGGMLMELPAGTLNPGEDPRVCAAREVREETGMAARKLEKLGEFYMVPGYSTEFMHVFLATGLYPDALEGDDDEFLKLTRIPVKEVFRMARAGEIRDGKTLAALLLASRYDN